MHIAEVVTIAKSLPLLRLNTYKSLILSYSADYRRIFMKKSSVGSDSSDIHYPAGVQRYFQVNKGYVFHGLHFCFVAKIHFFFYPQATTPKKSFLDYLSHIVILIIISCRKREIRPLLRTKRSRENSKTLGS